MFQIAREGDVVAGNTLNSFSNLQLTSQGLVAFKASLNGTSEEGLFVANEFNVQRFVQSGQTAAGGNGIYEQFDFDAENGTTELGRIAYRATLSGTAGGSSDDEGVFRSSINGTTRIAQKGDVVNGLSLTGFGNVRMSNTFAVAFESTTNVGDAILAGDNEELLVVVQAGQTVDGLTLTNLEMAGFNDRGQIAYKATTNDGRSVVQTWTPDLHWRIDGTGFWGDISRWTLGVNPDEVHQVFVDPTSQSTIFGPQSDATVKRLEIGDGTVEVLFDLVPDVTLSSIDGTVVRRQATLTGSGILATPELEVFGEVAPNGILEIDGNLALDGSSLFSIEIGDTPDLLLVSGDALLAGTLDVQVLSSSGFSPGDVLTLMDIQGSSLGQFNGFNENDLVAQFMNYEFFLTYQGGDGNDVALRVAIPEPGATVPLLILVGLLAKRRMRSR